MGRRQRGYRVATALRRAPAILANLESPWFDPAIERYRVYSAEERRFVWVERVVAQHPDRIEAMRQFERYQQVLDEAAPRVARRQRQQATAAGRRAGQALRRRWQPKKPISRSRLLKAQRSIQQAKAAGLWVPEGGTV